MFAPTNNVYYNNQHTMKVNHHICKQLQDNNYNDWVNM